LHRGKVSQYRRHRKATVNTITTTINSCHCSDMASLPFAEQVISPDEPDTDEEESSRDEKTATGFIEQAHCG
jgi:hypothetical protein